MADRIHVAERSPGMNVLSNQVESLKEASTIVVLLETRYVDRGVCAQVLLYPAFHELTAESLDSLPKKDMISYMSDSTSSTMDRIWILLLNL